MRCILFQSLIYILNWWSRENYGPVGSNTDSGGKIRVYRRDTPNVYLAFIIEYFNLSSEINKFSITINS
jgi:hypothetical protein